METRDLSIMLSYAKDVACKRNHMDIGDVLEMANAFARWLQPCPFIIKKALHDAGINLSDLNINDDEALFLWRESLCDTAAFVSKVTALNEERMQCQE